MSKMDATLIVPLLALWLAGAGCSSPGLAEVLERDDSARRAVQKAVDRAGLAKQLGSLEQTVTRNADRLGHTVDRSRFGAVEQRVKQNAAALDTLDSNQKIADLVDARMEGRFSKELGRMKTDVLGKALEYVQTKTSDLVIRQRKLAEDVADLRESYNTIDRKIKSLAEFTEARILHGLQDASQVASDMEAALAAIGRQDQLLDDVLRQWGITRDPANNERVQSTLGNLRGRLTALLEAVDRRMKKYAVKPPVENKKTKP